MNGQKSNGAVHGPTRNGAIADTPESTNGAADHLSAGSAGIIMSALEELRAGVEKSGRLRSRSDTPSIEDYDEISRPKRPSPGRSRLSSENGDSPEELAVVVPPKKAPAKAKLVVASNDAKIQEILRRESQRAKQEDPSKMKRRRPFPDAFFSRKHSTFDRENEATAASPFHGFFTLFWVAVFLSMFKLGVENVALYGNPFGESNAMGNMFLPDLWALLLSDGVMCALTGVSFVLQWLVYAGHVDWDRSGWILQNVWQTLFIAGVVGLTFLREWPWTHTVFFVLHGIVMLMKQHSYAFYNGYLSSLSKSRADLLSKLEQLDRTAPVQSPSHTEPPASAVSTSHLAHSPSAHQLKERRASVPLAPGPSSSRTAGAGAAQAAEQKVQEVRDIDKIAEAIRRGEPLDADQIHVFKRVLRWEVDALTDELKGKSTTPETAYPNNLTLANQYCYNLLPTLVYELEYPRSGAIRWTYVAEKAAGIVGIIFVMIMVSQRFIYPVVMKTVEMKELGLTLADQFKAFPWMLGELIFPFMLEYLLTWYLIWETILNLLAEITHFGDRSFYGPWWNSVSWDHFARDWNRPVHMFLLRHVYHSSISAMKVNKYTATLITFFLSACVHELVMWCIFKKLRGYLLMLQMFQLPLVQLSRTKLLRGRESIGNTIFWLGIFTGPSVLCSLYLIL